MLLGVDVGGTFTDAVLVAGAALSHRQGADDARRPVARACWPRSARCSSGRARGRRTSSRFAHGMTVATNALLEGHGARTALVATEGFTDVVELGRQARARPLPAVRGAARRRSRRPSGASARPSGWGRTACCGRSTTPASGAPTRSPRCEPEAVAVCLLHAYRDPATSARSATRCARGSARRPRLALARGRRHVPRVRARGDDGGRRRALAARRRLPARGSPARAARRGPARAADHAVQRRPAALARRRRRTPRSTVLSGPAGGAAAAALVAAAAGEPRPAVLRHGRHVVRRLRVVRTARCARPRAARSAAARWRCRWSTSTPSAPAAARSPGATPAARCASGRARRAPSPGPPATGAAAPSRPSPTPTSCSAGSTPAAPLERRRSSTSTRRARAVERLAASSASGSRSAREGIVRVANAEMVRALRVMTVERGLDPRALHAAGVRRRRPAARRRAGRRARHHADPGPAAPAAC